MLLCTLTLCTATARGGVIANGKNVGIIKNGVLQFKSKDKQVSVYVSGGGMPDSYTEYGDGVVVGERFSGVKGYGIEAVKIRSIDYSVDETTPYGCYLHLNVYVDGDILNRFEFERRTDTPYISHHYRNHDSVVLTNVNNTTTLNYVYTKTEGYSVSYVIVDKNLTLNDLGAKSVYMSKYFRFWSEVEYYTATWGLRKENKYFAFNGGADIELPVNKETKIVPSTIGVRVLVSSELYDVDGEMWITLDGFDYKFNQRLENMK